MNKDNIISTKEIFVANVQKWVTLDNQIKNLNEKTKEFRNRKTEVHEEIYKFMEHHKLLENKIKITDGELRIFEKKEQTGLTFGYLEKCLGELINDKSKVDLIIKYIKDNRETSITHELKRTYVKTETLSINNAT